MNQEWSVGIVAWGWVLLPIVFRPPGKIRTAGFVGLTGAGRKPFLLP